MKRPKSNTFFCCSFCGPNPDSAAAKKLRGRKDRRIAKENTVELIEEHEAGTFVDECDAGTCDYCSGFIEWGES